MIGVIFQFGLEHVEVRVDGHSVYFRISQFSRFVTIDGIKLDKSGVIKEFPDLKDNNDWKDIAIQRFREKISKMTTEKEIVKYIIDDLTKYGYKPLYQQESGKRVIKFK